MVQTNYGWIAWYTIGKEEYLPTYFLRLSISPAVNFILPVHPFLRKNKDSPALQGCFPSKY